MNRVTHLISSDQPAVPLSPSDLLRTLETSFAEFMRQLGFDDNESFRPVLATVAFVNAVVCARVDPDASAKLNARLEGAVADELVAEVRGTLGPEVARDPGFPESLQRAFDFLGSSRPAEWPLFGIALRLGLTAMDRLPQIALAALELPHQMHEEHQFLSGRLAAWSPVGFRRPDRPLFLEYIEWRYPDTPVERVVMVTKAQEIINRWPKDERLFNASLWAWAGWTRGKAFAEDRSDVAHALFAEVPPDTLAGLRAEAGNAFSDLASVDFDRVWAATANYLARHRGGKTLRELMRGQFLCAAAAKCFDYGFWMGALATTNGK